MKRARKQTLAAAVSLGLACLSGAGVADAQAPAPPQTRELMSDQAFKNIKY